VTWFLLIDLPYDVILELAAKFLNQNVFMLGFYELKEVMIILH